MSSKDHETESQTEGIFKMMTMNSILKHTAVTVFTLAFVLGCDGKAQIQTHNAANAAATEQAEAVEVTQAVAPAEPETIEDCVAFPLVNTGGEPEFQPDGTPTYPISFFGIGFGQKVDQFPPCPVDEWGIPRVGYAEEVCVWYDDKDMQKLSERGEVWKELSRYGIIMYPWNYCNNEKGMSSFFGLNDDGYIIYFSSMTDGPEHQNEIYSWVYSHMGDPSFHIILNPKSKGKEEIFEKGLPETLITLSGRNHDGVMVAIWQNDDYFIRLMPGIYRLDMGRTELLTGGRLLTNLEFGTY